MSQRIIINSPIQLYRHLLRRIQLLPSVHQDYYKHQLRQGFNSHSDESDPERVRQIIQRTVEDAEWILKKYSKPTSGDR